MIFKHCPECKNQLVITAKVCPKCNKKQEVTFLGNNIIIIIIFPTILVLLGFTGLFEWLGIKVFIVIVVSFILFLIFRYQASKDSKLKTTKIKYSSNNGFIEKNNTIPKSNYNVDNSSSNSLTFTIKSDIDALLSDIEKVDFDVFLVSYVSFLKNLHNELKKKEKDLSKKKNFDEELIKELKANKLQVFSKLLAASGYYSIPYTMNMSKTMKDNFKNDLEDWKTSLDKFFSLN